MARYVWMVSAAAKPATDRSQTLVTLYEILSEHKSGHAAEAGLGQ
jgi:hypothetical protein